jgi:hypothetical protein
MSEVRLLVRDAHRDWSGTIHGSCADRAIAALSADPTTMDELEAAVGRFEKRNPKYRFFSNLRPGSCAEPHDAGLVVIDLIARLVVVESTYSSPGHEGYVDYHNGNCCTDKSLRYHLADDWLFLSHSEYWEGTADKRRQERAAKPDWDTRSVLYGRPLLEFVARETLATFARRDEIAAAVRVQWIEKARQRLAKHAGIAPEHVDANLLTDEEVTPKLSSGPEHYGSPFYDTIKEIHAAWLLTPRGDLKGASPREIIVARHRHITWELNDRCEQWMLLRELPRGLAESTHAYQYAGFGTHEVVMYYEMVRALLWACWEKLSVGSGQLSAKNSFTTDHRQLTTDNPQLTTDLADFLTIEVPRLELVRESWLDTPDSELHGRTPRAILARERARLPETMSGKEAIVDPDCPLCQMLGDISGPGFWGLDGASMDDDFAFDVSHRTREDWDAEQRRREEFDRRFDAERAERGRLGVTSSTPHEDGTNAHWSRSFAVEETADVPLGMRVFGIGCSLAELIVGLRHGAAPGAELDRDATPPAAQRHIDRLNRDFGNLRELLQSDDSCLAEALIEPVLVRFTESLDAVATAHPDLASQCESLTSDLGQLLAPPEPEPTWYPDDGDDDDPY